MKHRDCTDIRRKQVQKKLCTISIFITETAQGNYLQTGASCVRASCKCSWLQSHNVGYRTSALDDEQSGSHRSTEMVWSVLNLAECTLSDQQIIRYYLVFL